MKKRKLWWLLTLLIAILIVVLTASIIYIIDSEKRYTERYAENSSATEEPQDLYYCEQDKDCVAVPKDACGCNSGGTDISVNKRYERYWQEMQGKKYQNMGCLAVIACSSKPLCVNNRCEVQITSAGNKG